MSSIILSHMPDRASFSLLVGPLLLVVLASLCYAVVQGVRSRKQDQKLPPSPPGHWLFGNTPTKSYPHRHFARLAETYGPVFTLRYGTRRMVIITRVEAAVDIMVKQSHLLADRPRFISVGELISGGLRTVSMGLCELLRKHRSSLHATLEPQIAVKYEHLQMQHARNHILDLLDTPDQFINHARRYASSVILSLTYGKTTRTSHNDPEVQQLVKGLERIAYAGSPGNYLIDDYPFLEYIPGFTSELKGYHQEELALFRGQIHDLKERQRKNEAIPCFALSLIERQDEFDLTDDELAYLAGSMFGAGSDTTAGVLPIVVMAAARHPAVQARVQAQLDKVVGRDRLPTFADREQLSEVCAYVQEIYRWRPVAPLGVPHKATEDVFWNGYVIPAGTEVHACHWAIGRDPDVYPDPEAFKPERWLNAKGEMRDDLKYYNWGFGRRICPGQHVAERSIYMNTALMLWAFEITEDPARPIDTMAIKDGAIAHPYPFVARFKPRIANLREKVLAHVE
ncbi:cytochrome P450 [Cubamyces sp. BRFM 1775]|nr:cytochrome P450 [Cubamyces sp. BRFM 1775]